MTEMQFKVKITATAEVRDVAGNLVSSEPIEATTTVNAEQAKALGYNTEGDQP